MSFLLKTEPTPLKNSIKKKLLIDTAQYWEEKVKMECTIVDASAGREKFKSFQSHLSLRTYFPSGLGLSEERQENSG